MLVLPSRQTDPCVMLMLEPRCFRYACASLSRPGSVAAVQTAAFTVTKIQPPRMRANLIEREALERRLGDALANRRLTLLSAPAGFGKTAALTRQLARLPNDIAV